MAELTLEGLPQEIRDELAEIKKAQTRIFTDLEPKIQKAEKAERGVSDLKDQVEKASLDVASRLDKANVKIDQYVQESEAIKEKAKEIAERMDELEKEESKKRFTFGAPSGFQPDFYKTLIENLKVAGVVEGQGDNAMVMPKKIALATIKSAMSQYRGYAMGQFPGMTKDISASGDTVYPGPTYTGIIGPGERRLRILDLLPIIPTSSRLVYFPSETSLTDNAGPQTQASSKGETTFVVTVASEDVKTIAHFSQVPLQMLADIPGLQGYINSRLLFLLEQVVEDQVLAGNNVGQALNGLVTQATAFDTTLDEDLGISSQTDIDRLRLAMAQVLVGSQFAADAMVLHPYDWASIELEKDSQQRYIFGMPQSSAVPRMWGVPVVDSTAQTSGDFLVGAFRLNAAVWDREMAQIAISTEDSDNFQKNMATIRAERRLTLTVYRTAAFVEGDLSAAVT